MGLRAPTLPDSRKLWRSGARNRTVKELHPDMEGSAVTRRLLFAALLPALLSTSACEIPRFEGPQIQSPPPGFLLQPEGYLQRRMFPEREIPFHTTWVRTDVSGVSVIYVNGHPGALTVDDVLTAQEGVRAHTVDPDTKFGAIEALTIDGRDAWGWEERVESTRRGLVDVAYRAVIPYDTITFAIEFISGDPNWKAVSPDSLRTIISSFAIGKTTLNLPVIGILAGAMLLAFNVLRTRARERDQRLRSINLVTIKKEQEEEEPGPPSV